MLNFTNFCEKNALDLCEMLGERDMMQEPAGCLSRNTS
jgi:hypothetical protein